LRALNEARSRAGTNLFVDLTSNNNAKITGCHQEFSFEVLSPIPALAAKGPGALDFKGRKLTSNSMSAVVRILKGGKPYLLLPGDMIGSVLTTSLRACPQPNATSTGISTPRRHAARRKGARVCRTHVPGREARARSFLYWEGSHNTPRPRSSREYAPRLHPHTSCVLNCQSIAPRHFRICPRHLSARHARGKIVKTGNQCCGGTAVLDLGGAKHTAGAHRWRAQALRDGSRADCTVPEIHLAFFL